MENKEWKRTSVLIEGHGLKGQTQGYSIDAFECDKGTVRGGKKWELMTGTDMITSVSQVT